jgi:DNA-binding XRE family transcriptional regulator
VPSRVGGEPELRCYGSGPPPLFGAIGAQTASSLPTTIRQIKAARALLGWSQSDLARHSGISVPAIARLEAANGELGGRGKAARKIRTALEASGIEFIEENGTGEGVRFRKPRHSKVLVQFEIPSAI